MRLCSIQLQDETIRSIVEQLQFASKMEIDDYVKSKGDAYMLVPKQLRFHFLNECHDKARLVGTDKTIGCAFNKQSGGKREGDYNYVEIKSILFVDYLVWISRFNTIKSRFTRPISSRPGAAFQSTTKTAKFQLGRASCKTINTSYVEP